MTNGELWTQILIGFRSGREITRTLGPGAPTEIWCTGPPDLGSRRVLAKRVRIDARNRTAYYKAGTLDWTNPERAGG